MVLSKGTICNVKEERKTYYVVQAEGKDRYVNKEAARVVTQVPIPTKPIVTGLQHFAPTSPFPTDGEKVPAPRPESEHYHTGGVDVWQFADENFSQIEVEGFHRINAIKYLARYGKKNGYNRKDLEKAIVSIEKLIELHDKDDRK